MVISLRDEAGNGVIREVNGKALLTRLAMMIDVPK